MQLRGPKSSGVLVLLTLAAAADACSSFDASEDEQGAGQDSGATADASDTGVGSTTDSSRPEGGDDGSVPGRPDADAGDAGTGDAGPVPYDAALGPLCVSDAGSIEGLDRALLWAPDPDAGEVEFPFQLDTDDLSLFWIAQPLPIQDLAPDAAPGPASTAYNGRGRGRIHRLLKSKPLEADTLADEQPLATNLALDGDFVYWTTAEPSTVLWRVRRDCTAPCTAQRVADLPISRSTWMRRARPGLLVLRDDANQIHAFETERPTNGTTLVTPTPNYAHASAANGELVVGADNLAEVQRFKGPVLQGDAGRTSIPTLNGFNPGFSALAADCSEVFGARNDRSLWRSDGGASFSRFHDSGVLEVVDLASDDRYLFLAAFNAGGAFVVDKTTHAQRTLYTGNVWNLTMDRDGVYWGEHAVGSQAGKIFALRR